MKEPIWLTEAQVLAFHSAQLAEHGGLAGVRDQAALEAALGRPVNQYAYGVTDIPALATAYTHGLAKNHPFIDGNKRVAFITALVFLGLNGIELTLTEEQAVEAMLALASSKLSLEGFAEVLRQHTRRARRRR